MVATPQRPKMYVECDFVSDPIATSWPTINLATNGNFESNSTYFQNNATYTYSSAAYLYGGRSLAIVGNNTTSDNYIDGRSAETFSLTAGQTYTASGWYYTNRSGDVLRLDLYYAAGPYIASAQTNSTVANTWTRLTVTFTAATTGSAGFVYRPTQSGGVFQSTTLYLDGVQLENGSTASPFTDNTGVWTDITQYVRGRGDSAVLFTSSRGRDYELGRVAAGTASLTLDNTDGRFDPTNEASPYYTGTGNPQGLAGMVTPGRRIRVRAVWQGIQYYLFQGQVETWPQTWASSGFYGEANVTMVDALSLLAAIDLPALNIYNALTLSPLMLCRCNDDTGSVSAANSSSINQPLSQIVAGSTATFTDSFSFGGTSGDGVLIADPTSSLQFSTTSWNASLGANPSGYALRTADLGVGPLLTLSGGFTISFYMRTSNSTKNANGTLFYQVQEASQNGTLDQIYVYLSTPASGTGLSITFSTTSTKNSSGGGAGGTATVLGGINVCDGEWHHIVCILAADNVTPYVFVDGVQDTAGVYPAGSAVVWTAAPYLNEWGGDPRPVYKSGTGYYDGYLKNLCLINYAISSASIASLFASGQGYPGDTTATRQGRLLDAAGWPPSQRVLYGSTTHGAQQTEGVKALEALQQVADTEGAPVYVGVGGSVRQDDRTSRYNESGVGFGGSFGEQSGEYHYLDDVAVEVNARDIYNDVTVSRVNGITVRVQDTTSQKRYGPRSLSLSSTASSDSAAVYLAEYLVATYKAPYARLPQITLDPMTQPSLFVSALSTALGYSVAVTRRPGAAPSITDHYFVEKITHTITASSWQTAFMLSPVDVSQVFALDDSTYGHIGGTATLSSAVTSTATTLSTTGATFSTTDVPYLVQVDTELMTVTASTGSSLTVTRGVNGTTAAAHASGANVTVNAYGLAL